MATMNGVKFRKNLVSRSRYRYKCPKSMNPKKITVHETDNSASANNEINYMIGNNNYVSYHIAVDENEAVQGIPFNRNAYHAGDGANGYGNRNTIGVEICRNFDRNRRTRRLIEPQKSRYYKAKENAVKVIAQLCVDHGIVANASNIKQHYDWNGKNCPSKMREDKAFVAFRNDVIKEYNRLIGGGKSSSNTSSSNSSSSSSGSKWTKKTGSWTGQSLFKWQYGQPITEMQTMLAENNPPFYPNRGEKNNGIDGYFGNDTENQVKRFQTYYDLKVDGIPGKEVYNQVTKNKGGKKKSNSSTKSKPKGDMKTTSLVDYLASINEDSSFSNRQKLAKKHGVSNYKGTAAQNTELLNKLRSGSTGSTKTSSNTSSGKTVHLPASAKTWKTYKLNVQPVAKNSDWSLTPSRYGGLTYKVLGEPYPNVVTINTSRRKRNIYVGSGTGAVIK